METLKINQKQFQPFGSHLVTPSPWPILVSFSLLNFAIGAVTYLHGIMYGNYIFLCGIIITTAGMLLWFRDVIIEGLYLGDHTKVVQKGLALGIILFIVSEAFVFLSVFWAYFHSSLSPAVEMGGNWPPTGIAPLDALGIPLWNTILLLSSGASVTYAHHSLVAKWRVGAIDGFLITIFLAVVFTYLQVFEYLGAPFTIAHGVYGTCFYSSTGLHGIHVVFGTIFIIVALTRTVFHHFTPTHHVGVNLALVYWHFVDGVWLGLYLAVYFWGGGV